MQRHLPRLARGPAENQQPDRGRNRHPRRRDVRFHPRNRGLLQASRSAVVEQQRACLRVKPHHPDQQPQIAHARGDERLLRCRRSSRALKPEPDQQVRRQPDDFPTHEQQQQAVRDHHAQHCSRKQREEAEEAREVVVVRHVAEAVNKDQQPHKADHHQHHCGQRIQQPSQLYPLIPKLHPVKRDHAARRIRERLRERHQRQHQRNAHRPNGQPG